MTLDTDTLSTDLAGLAAELNGPLMVPGDTGFDAEIATFNLATTHRPAIVAGAASAGDVAAAIRYATGHGLPVGVQATGHGAMVPVEGMLISTRRMNAVAIDPAARTAAVGAGVRWAEVIRRAAEHGLAPLNGSSSDVGAVGYTLGGGLPVMSRTFGFAADHVRSLEVVTAEGAVRQVDAANEPELFWALRGGKGNVGVVTSMVIDLFPVARLYGGGLFYPGTAAPAVLRAYREWSAGLPETTSTSIALLRLPPIPEVPKALRGQFVVHLRMAHVGGAAEGERLLAPMRQTAPVMIDEVRDMPYTECDTISHDPDHPLPVYERVALLSELTLEAVETLLAFAGPEAETPLLMVELRHLGGALCRRPEIPNAVGGRDAAFSVFLLGVLMPQIAAIVPRAVDAGIVALAPHSTGGTFVNMHGRPGDAADRARPWPADVFARLGRVKAAYDPANVFPFGHAITPAGS